MFSIIFMLMFVLVFGMFIAMFVSTIAKSVKTKKHNDSSPLLTVEAKVVTKRTHVRGDHAHTNYFVTFEFENGDRQELQVDGYQFGMMVEGDSGKLSFKGTQFVDFVRA